MDPATRQIYESRARDWIAARRPAALESGALDRFAARLTTGATVADLGCGPGWYAGALEERGFRSIAVDLSRSMLRAAANRVPGLRCVCADLAHLPLGRASLDAALAVNCYVHVPRDELPLALAHLHAALRVDGLAELTFANLDHVDATSEERESGEAERRFTDDAFRGRLFSAYSAERVAVLLEGAGFHAVDVDGPTDRFWLWIRARRARTLPDFVRPGLRILVCGLNPSLHAADAGVPFARPGNRFWPAAHAAGLADRERDPFGALAGGLGFTDLAKRATRRASELRREEYRTGLARVETLVRRYRPRAVCFVGLEGWRRAVDPRATPGRIRAGFAGCPAYLMPSTSGINAHIDLEGCTRHLRLAVG